MTMIVVIDRPTATHPEYTAWTADCPNGVIIGTGKTLDEAKSDFLNSVEEFKEDEDILRKEFMEYLEEKPCFYLSIE